MNAPGFKIGLLIGLNLIVWCLNVLCYKGSIRLTAKSGYPLTLDTDPQRVHVLVDGKIWDSPRSVNGWVQSPATLRLYAGLHKMTLERPGYVSHTFKIQINESDNGIIKSVLESTDQASEELEVTTESADLDSVTVTVDGGVESDTIPIFASDLLPGIHSLEFKINGTDGNRIRPYFCSVTLPQPNGNDGAHVVVAKIGKKLKVTGCKRAK